MTPVAASTDPLSASVLVLNRFYMAVHVVNVRRAFGLLFRELAEVIHIDQGQYANYSFDSWREISELKAAFKEPHEDWISAVHFEIQVPRVIRLLAFDRVPKQTIRFNRRNVFSRDGNRCQYCGHSFPTSELSLDHVVPRSRNGKTGQHGVRLRGVQREERGPHAPRSTHEADPSAHQAQAQPVVGHQAGQSQVRELEDVSG